MRNAQAAQLKAQKHALLGIQISLLDSEQILDFMRAVIEAEEAATILSGNVHAFNLAYSNPWLRHFFNQADIVRLDGAGIRLGLRILGQAAPARSTWADFGWELARAAAEQGHRLYFLGAKPGVAEQTAKRIRERHPNIQIVGVHDGYFDKTQGSAENEAVLEQINAAKPDILIVGFGMPLQERWLIENRSRLDANVVITGGAVFDYLSGNLRRGPKWMTDNGLEWLARMLIEPRRLWRRYVLGNPLFLWRVGRQWINARRG